MSDRERIEKAIGLIIKAGIKNRKTTPEEVYKAMYEYELGDVADELAKFNNLVYDIRDTLEGE